MGKAIKDKEAKAEEIVETVETVEAPEAEKAEETIEEPETIETPEKEETVEEGEEYEIKAPNDSYSGLTATVEFKNGVGKTKNKIVADYFKARNFKVTASK